MSGTLVARHATDWVILGSETVTINVSKTARPRNAE